MPSDARRKHHIFFLQKLYIFILITLTNHQRSKKRDPILLFIPKNRSQVPRPKTTMTNKEIRQSRPAKDNVKIPRNWVLSIYQAPHVVEESIPGEYTRFPGEVGIKWGAVKKQGIKKRCDVKRV